MAVRWEQRSFGDGYSLHNETQKSLWDSVKVWQNSSCYCIDFPVVQMTSQTKNKNKFDVILVISSYILENVSNAIS